MKIARRRHLKRHCQRAGALKLVHARPFRMFKSTQKGSFYEHAFIREIKDDKCFGKMTASASPSSGARQRWLAGAEKALCWWSREAAGRNNAPWARRATWGVARKQERSRRDAREACERACPLSSPFESCECCALAGCHVVVLRSYWTWTPATIKCRHVSGKVET